MMRRLSVAVLLLASAAGCTEVGDSPFMPLDVGADAPTDLAGEAEVSPPLVTWEDDIRPLLEDKGCSAQFCHGAARQSGLSVESVADLEQGGDHGPAVVPCEPGEGTLLDKMGPDPSFDQRMPIGGPFLTDAELALVEAWIAQGARVDSGDAGCEAL